MAEILGSKSAGACHPAAAPGGGAFRGTNQADGRPCAPLFPAGCPGEVPLRIRHSLSP